MLSILSPEISKQKFTGETLLSISSFACTF